MKSTTHLFPTCLMLAALFFFSCQKDLDQIELIPSETYLTNIFGIITDENGDFVEGALVTYKTQDVLSDQYGTYLFKNIEVDSRYNHLNIRKEGYFLHTRTFRSDESKLILLQSKIVPKTFEFTISSNEPSSITKDKVRIEFDGKGMVTQDGNETYEGEVDVAIQYLNPLSEEIGDIMPGDLSGVNSENSLRLLESFGMVGVELRAKDGRELQLADQSVATLSVEISNELISEAPDEIPLWHFDHANGLWVEEGKANKVGNTYTGNVSHFSFWNFDLPRMPVMVNGRLIDPNGIGLASMQVKILRAGEKRGGSGYTDYDGYFSGPIEKDMVLELTVVSRCNGEEVVYSEQIGPFDKETDLGDIVLDIPNIEYLAIQGDFINCNGEVLEDGLLKINDLERPDYFPVIGGSIDKTFGICGLESIELEIIDRQGLQKKSLGSFDVPGSASVGVVTVCDEKVNFATINSSTFNIDLVMVDSISFTANGTSKSILAYDYSYELAVIEVKYVDQDDTNIELGTHQILKMVCNWRIDASTFEVVLILDEGEITIEEVDYDEKTVKGSYKFEATVDILEEKHEFQGSFFSYF